MDAYGNMNHVYVWYLQYLSSRQMHCFYYNASLPTKRVDVPLSLQFLVFAVCLHLSCSMRTRMHTQLHY
jgi:hypothetical protein